jgi:YVTN family beta-propeller protein
LSSNLSSYAVFAQTLHDMRLSEVVSPSSQESSQIDVGDSPIKIGIHERTNTVYVVKDLPDTVSVISGENNTKIGEDIPVGDYPAAIAVNQFKDTVYVANRGSNSISVIDGETNEVVAGVTFRVNPFNSGYILCEESIAPVPNEQYRYLSSGNKCTATPFNERFEFVSWVENLEGNSTQLINFSRPASLWDSHGLAVANFPQDNASLVTKFLQGNKPVEPEAKLTTTKFGTFTANFREVPPTIPIEFWFAFLTTIAGSITAAFFGAQFGQRRKNK